MNLVGLGDARASMLRCRTETIREPREDRELCGEIFAAETAGALVSAPAALARCRPSAVRFAGSWPSRWKSLLKKIIRSRLGSLVAVKKWLSSRTGSKISGKVA